MTKLRVLIGCECSGEVRRAFRARGHDAWSCDLKQAEDESPYHIHGDLLDVMNRGWDIGIFHPTCRYLANSGAKHLYRGMKKENGPDEIRWSKMREGAAFFLACLNAPIARVCVENPIIHGHAKAIIGVQQTQTIQPWMFGHGEIKATCLWLKGLPRLTPTDIVDGREPRVHRMAPGPQRETERSRTYPGIAAAMAVQWSRPLEADLLSSLGVSEVKERAA